MEVNEKQADRQQKVEIIGLVGSREYEETCYLANWLSHSFPKQWLPPTLRPHFDVAWQAFRCKLRRRLRPPQPWRIDQNVAIFAQPCGTYIGEFAQFQQMVQGKYWMDRYVNYHALALADINKCLENSEGPLVYFVISIQGEIIGSLLFQLFYDILPFTCKNFLKLVKRKDNGYKGTIIHRICKTSWVQFGGFKLKPSRIACENYAVPHNRRGVLSMCHDGKHENNSTQFFVTTDSTPWMDYYFVAFGQLIHGDAILQRIENVSTLHECPVCPIIIEECGEFTMIDEPSPELLKIYKTYQYWQSVNRQKEMAGEDYKSQIYPVDMVDSRDATSELSITKFKRGLYSV